ncbi:MAG: hypothetical protein ACLFQK_08360 [Fibrobacterota bacterium]
MIESLTRGAAGLAMVVWSWFTPPPSAGIEIVNIKSSNTSYIVSCRMNLGWNKKLEQILDAGIPLKMRYYSASGTDSIKTETRVLSFIIEDYSYRTSRIAKSDTVDGKSHDMVLFALKDFQRWEFSVPDTVKKCEIGAEVMLTRAPELGRIVDVSRIWGYKRIKKEIELK